MLNACKEHGNVRLARIAAERALELDPQNAGVLALLSGLYAKLGMWDKLEQLTTSMKDRGLMKDAGCSWIEIKS